MEQTNKTTIKDLEEISLEQIKAEAERTGIMEEYVKVMQKLCDWHRRSEKTKWVIGEYIHPVHI